MTANEIRDSYKKFFESKGHVIVPSAPMVIKDDPTLMFTNAGMNQWKDIILGTRQPEPRRCAGFDLCDKHNTAGEQGIQMQYKIRPVRPVQITFNLERW